MPEFSEESLKLIAKQKIKKMLVVDVHVGVYISTNILLIVINLLTCYGFWWFPWPLCSWAIGLTIHVASYRIWSRRSHGEQGRCLVPPGYILHCQSLFDLHMGYDHTQRIYVVFHPPCSVGGVHSLTFRGNSTGERRQVVDGQ